MLDPLAATKGLVKGISEMVDGVKSNSRACSRLAERAASTLDMLETFLEETSSDPEAAKAIELVNRALKEAKYAVDDCRNTSYFCALFSHRSHCCAIKEASDELQFALSQMYFPILLKASDSQSRLASMSDDRGHQ